VSFEQIAHLRDIAENIERIKTYISGLDRDSFGRDGRTFDAVERCLERICEAATRLGDEAAELMPDQPWKEIRGTGNWLRHAYHRVDPTIIWDTVVNDLPKLLRDVCAVLENSSF